MCEFSKIATLFSLKFNMTTPVSTEEILPGRDFTSTPMRRKFASKAKFLAVPLSLVFLFGAFQAELLAQNWRPGGNRAFVARPLLIRQGGHYVYQELLERPAGAANYSIAETPEEFRNVIEKMKNLDEKDEHGMTLLHYLVRSGHNLEQVHILLEQGARIDVKTETGETPLFFARDPEVIRLLKLHEADFAAKNQRKETALHYLVKPGVSTGENARAVQPLPPANLETYVAMIESGADPNAQDENLETALHLAAKEGIVPETLDYLLEKGASLNAKNINEETPFHLLSLRKNYDKGIKTLLRYEPELAETWRYGITPLHYQIAFSGDAELIGMLLDRGFDPNAKDAYGVTPLQLAVYYARGAELVELLVKRGADVKVIDGNGNTLLHWVARNDEDDSVAKILLEAGVELEPKNQSKATALHELFLPQSRYKNSELAGRSIVENEERRKADYFKRYDNFRTPKDVVIPTVTNQQKQMILELQLTKRNNFPILKAMLEHGVEVNAVNARQKNMTALMIAMNYQRKIEDVALLIEHGADLSVKDSDGNTVAHYARTPEHFRLLAEKKVDFNQRNNAGDTCFMNLMQWNLGTRIIVPNYLESLEILAENGYDFDLDNHEGETPLSIAVRSYDANIELVKALMKHAKNLQRTDASGRTLVHFAACNRNPELLKLILQQGLDLHQVDNEGNSPLHSAAASYGNFKTAEFLIESGVDVNVKNKKGETPLFATFTKSDGMTEFLVRQGADPGARDNKGNTVLHALVGVYDAKIMKFFLSQGVDIDATNDAGLTPLHLAARSGTPVSLRCLLIAGADADIKTRDGETARDLLGGENEKQRDEKNRIFHEAMKERNSK